MKLKRIGLALFACLSIILFNGVYNELNAIDNSYNCGCSNNPKHEHREGRRPDILRSSIEELQRSGVLDKEDVAKIKEFNKKKMKEEATKKYSIIDEMVSENVITKEKGQKLKAMISQKVEEFVSESNVS